MLQGFLRQTDIDILFLQEVDLPNLDVFRGYETYYNVGTTMCGTAIITRDGITPSNITKLPSVPDECC